MTKLIDDLLSCQSPWVHSFCWEWVSVTICEIGPKEYVVPKEYVKFLGWRRNLDSGYNGCFLAWEFV